MAKKERSSRRVSAAVVLATRLASGWVTPMPLTTRGNSQKLRRFSAPPEENEVDLSVVAEALGLSLSLRGGQWWARCPFHDERTSSFTITDELGVYHCFGCGAKGGAVTLAQHVKECSYAEAKQFVASLAPKPRFQRVAREQQRCSVPELRSAVSACAAAYAYELAYSGEAGAARRYLEQRGVSPRTAARFGLGYAPTRGLFLASSLRSRVSETALVASGVAYAGSAPLRDRFAGRLVLPIRDAAGSPLGFGSRALPSSLSEVKYANSPTTDIFAKSSLLYGLDVAAPAIRARDEAVVVEGYFDVLALHEIGVGHAVGSLGVALGAKQIEQAARFCDSRRVVLLLDADAAGQNALDKLVTAVLPDLVEQAGLDVRIAYLPSSCSFKDAADYVEHLLTRRRRDAPSSQGESLAATESLADHFQRTVLDAAVSWTERRATTLLRGVFGEQQGDSSFQGLSPLFVADNAKKPAALVAARSA